MTTVLAAPGDTWGISGPRFLEVYLILAVSALVFALVWRRAAIHGADLATHRQPHPVELAYLNGGPTLALHTSLAGLRCAGAIGPGPTRGTVVATGPVPGGFSDLDYPVHAAARTPRTIPELRTDQGVGNALRRVSDRLIEDGQLLSPARRALARSAVLVLLAVLALAVARIAAGINNHKPVLYLVFAAMLTFVAMLPLLSVPTVSRTGRKLLRRLRSSNRHLVPSQAPSWATYGAAGAMLGVALYGTSALWAADPAFAAQAGIAQLSAPASNWSASSGNCSGGDSGSSSCSSGSSCGGGGCGGGGCGG